MFEKVIKKIVKIAGDIKEIDECEILDVVGDSLSKVDFELLCTALEKNFDISINYIENIKDEKDPDESDLDVDDSDDMMLNDFADMTKSVSIEETNDPVRMYLKSIGHYPLIKVDEERRLGKLIVEYHKAKNKLDELKKDPNADSKKINQLKRAIEKGEEASRKLTSSNLRLVVSLAKKYEKSSANMPFLDLIQEGNLGLMRAAEKYDYTRGFKFSTYATWWIKQGITRSIAEKSRTIRIPVHMNETINKMNKAKRALIQELGREPSEEEIVKRVNEKDLKQKLTVEKLRYIKSISPNPVSLETPVGEEEESQFGDLISDKKTPNPHQNMVDEILLDVLADALKKNLTDREEKVLRMRTGLYDGHEYTLEEVGVEFNVTRERIRQIENKAKAKLKKPHLQKLLASVQGKKNSIK